MNDAAPPTRRLLSPTASKLAVIGLLLLLIYALAGFVAAPWLVRQQLPKLVEEHLGAGATIGDVRINPFLFSFEASDLAIAEKKRLAADAGGSGVRGFRNQQPAAPGVDLP
jgi:hypothetical protein